MAWGGAAFDPTHHLLIIPTNNMATEVYLIPRADFGNERAAGRNFNGDWEFAPMTGTPYGMKRRTLRSPTGRFAIHRRGACSTPWIPIPPKSNGPSRSVNSLPRRRTWRTPRIWIHRPRWTNCHCRRTDLHGRNPRSGNPARSTSPTAKNCGRETSPPARAPHR